MGLWPEIDNENLSAILILSLSKDQKGERVWRGRRSPSSLLRTGFDKLRSRWLSSFMVTRYRPMADS